MRTIERRNKALLFLVSLVVLLLVFYGNDFGIQSEVGELKRSEAEYNELMADREAGELEYSFRLKVGDYYLPQDAETGTFLMSINQIEDFEQYNPEIEVVMERNISYDVALLDQQLTPETLENNEPLKVMIYSDDKYEEYDIQVTTLPVLSIDLNHERNSPDYPITSSDSKGSMNLYDGKEQVESDLYIRLRGGTSRAFPKNQYRINLREFTIGGDEKLNHQSLLGMREDDDWIIYAPYNDPEKARNTFSNNLWHDTVAAENRFGVNTGTEGRYVEVFINGDYWGLYTLMHPIDDKQVELDTKKDVEKSELYYRSISNIDFEPHHYENSTGDEMALSRFELREPDEPFGEKEQWEPLYTHMMMQQTDLATLENYLTTHTDIDNQINYYLFTLLLQATDNNFKNHNYISKLDGDTRVMLESPWDVDLTWGLRWHPDDRRLAIVKGEPEQNMQPTATLVHSAIQKGSTEITQKVKEKYRQLRADEWSDEAMMARLDEHEAAIYHSGAIRRDKARWPDTAYNETMDHLRNYMLERLQATDDFIEQGI